jgi:hypothetical protein
MADFDPKKFKELLDTGKKDEARLYAESCLGDSISNEETGKTLLEHTMSYMKASNALNEAYKKELEGILEVVKQVNQNEKDGEDKLNLLKVRADLNS